MPVSDVAKRFHKPRGLGSVAHLISQARGQDPSRGQPSSALTVPWLLRPATPQRVPGGSGPDEGRALQPGQAERRHRDPEGWLRQPAAAIPPARKVPVTGWAALEFKMQKLHLSSPEPWESTKTSTHPEPSARHGPAIWAPPRGCGRPLEELEAGLPGGLGREAQRAGRQGYSDFTERLFQVTSTGLFTFFWFFFNCVPSLLPTYHFWLATLNKPLCFLSPALKKNQTTISSNKLLPHAVTSAAGDHKAQTQRLDASDESTHAAVPT